MAAFSLQPALDLAERRAEAKSRVVKTAYVAWLNARTHLVRLEQRRHLYSGEITRKLQQGCSASMAQEAGEALRQWQANMNAALREQENAQRTWQLALDDWQVEKKRVEAFMALARRHALEERRREEKREHRLHDELSARSAYAQRFSEQHGVGFLHAQEDQHP
jgi:flagellar FliJ protein